MGEKQENICKNENEVKRFSEQLQNVERLFISVILGSRKGVRKESTMNQKLEQLKGNLIVSCQALPHEPLHSSFIMGRMARAAAEGGALGIRANTPEDIAEIRKNVDLPIIGIVKRDYEDSKVYITPTMKEIHYFLNKWSSKMIKKSFEPYFL